MDAVIRPDSEIRNNIYVSAGCEPEVNGHLGWAWAVMESRSWGVVLSVPVQREESPSLQVLGASSLALWV